MSAMQAVLWQKNKQQARSSQRKPAPVNDSINTQPFAVLRPVLSVQPLRRQGSVTDMTSGLSRTLCYYVTP